MDEKAAFENFPPIGFVIATKMVVEEENKVCFMYRETPMDAQDSGWRLFAGTETQEYVDVADNSGIYAPTTVLMIDESIRELLLEPVGSAFERESPEGDWYAAEGFAADGESTIIHDLGDGWSIELPGDFEVEEEEDGALVFAGPSRTVRIAFYTMEEKTAEQIYKEHLAFVNDRDQTEIPTISSFEFEIEDQKLLGFLVEEEDEGRTFQVLYGFTLVGKEVAQFAAYFDDEDDREWAIETWMELLKDESEDEAEATLSRNN